jgi:hypothetical protein
VGLFRVGSHSNQDESGSLIDYIHKPSQAKRGGWSRPFRPIAFATTTIRHIERPSSTHMYSTSRPQRPKYRAPFQPIDTLSLATKPTFTVPTANSSTARNQDDDSDSSLVLYYGNNDSDDGSAAYLGNSSSLYDGDNSCHWDTSPRSVSVPSLHTTTTAAVPAMVRQREPPPPPPQQQQQHNDAPAAKPLHELKAPAPCQGVRRVCPSLQQA